MKSTDGNTDMVWPQVGLPEHCRSECRAKMRCDLSSLLPIADIDFGRSFGANMFLLEVGTDAEHRTGSPLTLPAVAGDYGIGIGGYFDTQSTARAMSGSRHNPLRQQVRRDYRRAGIRATLSLLTALCLRAGTPRSARSRLCRRARSCQRGIGHSLKIPAPLGNDRQRGSAKRLGLAPVCSVASSA